MAENSPSLYRAGQGEPVVLLHGFTGHWRHWTPVLSELSARFEVIAPALSGHRGGPAYESDGFAWRQCDGLSWPHPSLG
jgi:pimeloyl-ACP methyl ester carboxylesterase